MRRYLSKDLNKVKPWTVRVSDCVQKPCGRSRLPCLLRNLCAGQEAAVTTGQGQRTGSKLGKEYVKAVYCHPVF